MKKKAARKLPAKSAAPKKKVRPIPAGYHSVTPYLSVRGAAQAIEFYKKAFGAKEIMRMPGPDGKVGHAEVRIGDSRVMLADEYEAIGFLSPHARGGTTVTIHLYVK
ncbi:MAG: VOC family protein, partial [Methylocella sp.]